MGALEQVQTGARYPLASRTLVGRSHACQLRLDSQQVSGVHAELAWDGERWLAHDLGSRNGTHVDGQRLAPNQRQPLSQGSQIVFGTGKECFVLADASPPGLVATSDDGRLAHAVGGLLCLPSEDEPRVTLLEQLDGRWVLETEDDARPVAHEAQITVDGVGWRIHLPGPVQHTDEAGEDPMTVASVELEFTVSLDEEHVAMRVCRGSTGIALRPRAHDFFLLTLARARLEDQRQPHLDSAEHGWVYRQDLARRLQVDRNLLNLWIYRARRQFAEAGIVDVANLVERRLGSEQLRLGVPRLRVAGR
jgi:pSer/pThr/pTyr-binding forkhead associated (FHA) protein